jgi:lipid A ethanolaminephosphotransferase
MLKKMRLGELFTTKEQTFSIYKLNGLLALWLFFAYNLPFLNKVWDGVGDKSVGVIILIIGVAIYLLLLNLLLILCANIRPVFKPFIILTFFISTILLYSNSTGKQYNPWAFEMSQWLAGTGRFLTLNFALHFIFLFLLPSVVLSIINIKYDTTKRHIIKTLAAIGLVSLSLFSIHQLTQDKIRPYYHSMRSALVDVIPMHFVDSSIKYVQHQYFEPVHSFAILDNAPYLIDKNVHTTVVLIVGQSIRADAFTKDNLLSFEQHAGQESPLSACDTYAESSIQCMFSFLSLAEFNDKQATHQQNVLDILALSGVNIFWLSHHESCGDLCKRANVSERRLKCKNKQCYDHDLINTLLVDVLHNAINPKAPNLVIIQTQNIGSPLYSRFYPNEFSTRVPECNTLLVANCNNGELINSYRNAVDYMKFVLAQAISRIEQFHVSYPITNTSLMFTAKYGESLGEKGLYFHGSPKAVAPSEQLLVPLLIVDNNLPSDCLSMLNGKLSHDFVSHTLLGYFHTRSKTYSPEFDIGYLCKSQAIEKAMLY